MFYRAHQRSTDYDYNYNGVNGIDQIDSISPPDLDHPSLKKLRSQLALAEVAMGVFGGLPVRNSAGEYSNMTVNSLIHSSYGTRITGAVCIYFFCCFRFIVFFFLFF